MQINAQGKQTKKKDFKRKAIIDAATKVFSMKGYNEASIKDITDEAEVSVGSFYSYFVNKEDVIAQLYDEIADMSIKAAGSVAAMAGGSVAEKFTGALTTAIWTFTRNEDLSRILLIKCTGINSAFEAKRWEILERIRGFLKEVLSHLNLAHSVGIADIDVASVALAHSILGVIIYWLDGRLGGDLREIAVVLSAYHLGAMHIEFTHAEVKLCVERVLAGNYEEILNGGN